MSKFLLYADLSRRQLVSSDGGTFSLPSLTLGDTATFALRVLDRDSAGTLAQRSLTVRTLRASIGPVLQAPAVGMFTLRFAPGHETLQIAPDASAEAIRSAVRSLPEIATYPLAEVITGTDRGVWILRFETAGPVPIEVATNRLTPRAFVRVRAYQTNEVWWHELRLIVTPLVFTGSHDRVLPDAPEITRIRAGSPRVEESTANTNEVQALHVPTDFKGTYYLQFDYRSSRLIGIDDGPDQIAEALNAMWTDGKTRFVVTNPETNHAYIEFTGPLEAWPQPLITISVHTFEVGDLTFSLNLKTAELASALRAVPSIQLPLEVEIEAVDDNADPSDPSVPGQILTLFSATATIVREQIWEELASVPEIDWLRPPQPKNYIPFNASQVITGTQFYVATLGDGTATTFVIDHNLGTEALHLTVRENISNGHRLAEDTYQTVFTNANSITLIFATAPAANAIAVVISTAGPTSAFVSGLTVEVAQVNRLIDMLNDLGSRVTTLEALVPAFGPVSASNGTSAPYTIKLTEKNEVLFLSGASGFGDSGMSATLPKRGPFMLPAINTADAPAALTIPLPSPVTAGLWQSASDGSMLIAGGGGIKASMLDPRGFVGSDGRILFPVRKAGSASSYFPIPFERELWRTYISEKQFVTGKTLSLKFGLAVQLANATSNAQWVLVIEKGTAPAQTVGSPDTAEINLLNLVWDTANPILKQRLILTPNPVSGDFGLEITRATANTFTCNRFLYTGFEASPNGPTDANFALRARLIDFDTENSVPAARGWVGYRLTKPSDGELQLAIG